VRRLWPGVLDRVKEIRRLPWVVLSQNAQLLALDGDTLTIGLVNTGARDSFVSTGSVEVLKKAMQEALGVSWKVEAIVDPTSTPAADAAPESDAVHGAAKRGTSAPESIRQAVKDGPPASPDDPDAAAHPDDPVIDSPLDPEQLVATELGGKVIDEST
jgi:DNA polymerase-3 subunit gamma/tau